MALVQSEDNCIKSVVPETIGYTGTNPEGKSPLIELGNIMTDWLDRLTTHGHLIRLEPAFQVTSINQSSLNSELSNYRVSAW